MGIFTFIFFIIILILGVGLGIIRAILGLLFGRKEPISYQQNGGGRANRTGDSRSSNTWQQSSRENPKKVFDQSEGEYIEFEEIKEEK